ncbi:hypothetical protein [Nakamurella lactea]|uniref:hypothetical protein n=1 Tax=Nakamurella lactea TaxID=459515 RepID=UPI000402FED2|nr:hypothetical protein [Nakamurella lactea]
MRILTRIGVLLLVLGLGSLVLRLMDMHFTVLAWADDLQPGLGIGFAVLGAGLVLADVVSRRENTPAQPPLNQQAAYHQPQFNQPAPDNQPQFNTSPPSRSSRSPRPGSGTFNR